MNKHFEDALYYLRRAGETAKAGLAEEIESIEARIRDMMGQDTEVEQSRLDELKTDLKELQERAEGDARERIAEARERIDTYRSQRQEA